MDDKPTPLSRSYDLFLKPGSGFRLRNTDRGVTLTDRQLAWTADGVADQAPLENIRQVRLQCGGDWRNPLNQCQITFADAYTLTVTDGNASGVADDAQTAIYADFVRALHARLAPAPAGAIRFVQGYPETNFIVVTVAAILLGVIFVAGPVVAWIITGQWQTLLPLIAGVMAAWPLYRMVENNRPRPYDPRQLPEALME